MLRSLQISNRYASRTSTRMLRDFTNRPGASRHPALERRGIHAPPLQTEHIQRTAASDHHKLPAIELISDGWIPYPSNRRLPEHRAVAGSEGDKVSRHISCERYAG